MEGLIPFVYRAVVEHKDGRQWPLSSWLEDPPTASYTRLSRDSGRLQDLRSEYGVSMASPPLSREVTPPASSDRVVVSTGFESPVSRLTPRRAAGTCSY